MIDPKVNDEQTPETATARVDTSLASESALPIIAPGFSGQPDDLHDLLSAPENYTPSEEDDPLAALRNDPNYSALIAELEYIAHEAKKIFAEVEEAPSDNVWDKIASALPSLGDREESPDAQKH